MLCLYSAPPPVQLLDCRSQFRRDPEDAPKIRSQMALAGKANRVGDLRYREFPLTQQIASPGDRPFDDIAMRR
jgi:hypothetical protein